MITKHGTEQTAAKHIEAAVRISGNVVFIDDLSRFLIRDDLLDSNDLCIAGPHHFLKFFRGYLLLHTIRAFHLRHSLFLLLRFCILLSAVHFPWRIFLASSSQSSGFCD